MKHIILLFFISLTSCYGNLHDEKIKTIESISASKRLNNSDRNSNDIFDEIR